MFPSLIQIGLKTAEKNSARTNKQTDRHYENKGRLAVNQNLHATKRERPRHLYVCHDVAVHLDGHLVNVVLNAVVHHRVDKHEHHVALELGRRADQSTVNVLLDC